MNFKVTIRMLSRAIGVYVWIGLLLGFIALGLGFLYLSYPFAVLSPLYGGLWIGWYLVLLTGKREDALRLFALWVAIDLSILLLFACVWHQVGDYSNTNGSELPWFFAYFPVVIPVSLLGSFFSEMSNVESYIRPYCGFTLSSWIELSIYAAIQCFIAYFVVIIIKHVISKAAT